ncbi:uncharacterized protein [Diadema antillarum]|uniref:uncharacterized protein n=1 Tax=Diadema antillarum TaxID=105358 RepID=UPI003A8790B8
MASNPVGPAPGPMAENYQHAVIVQQTNPNQSCSRYNAKRGRATGWVQLMCSILAIALGIAQLLVRSIVSVVGYGIWSGILFFLPTGILGVVSHNKNKCVIVSYMVMSILSCLAAVTGLGLNLTLLVISVEECNYVDLADCDYNIHQARIAVDALITIVSFVELVMAIVAASFCCAGVCCGAHQPNTVVTQYYNNPAPVVVMSPTGYTQQQMAPPYGQPAAYVPHQCPQSGMMQPTY